MGAQRGAAPPQCPSLFSVSTLPYLHDHQRPYLWRVVDQGGNVLDILLRRQDKKAAMKFFRKLLKGLAYVLRVIITDKLKSYAAAKRELLPGVEHRQHRYLNNRVENSHRHCQLAEPLYSVSKSQDAASRSQFCDSAESFIHCTAASTTRCSIKSGLSVRRHVSPREG